MYVSIYLCQAVRTGAVWYGSLSHYVRSHMLLHMCALTVSDARWCGTGRYSTKYIHTGVEGHSKARQRLAQGIPALYCIPSFILTALNSPIIIINLFFIQLPLELNWRAAPIILRLERTIH